MTILINQKEQALIDSTTGDIVRPNCWHDLIPYISYIRDRGHTAKAEEILQRVFEGEKFITKMVEASQKRMLGDTVKVAAYKEQE